MYPCKKILVKYQNTKSGENDIGTLYSRENIVGEEVSALMICAFGVGGSVYTRAIQDGEDHF